MTGPTRKLGLAAVVIASIAGAAPARAHESTSVASSSASARPERSNDPEAILALMRQLGTDNPLVRRDAIRKLSENHGEYAVPYLLRWLGDTSRSEKSVTAVQTLSHMDRDVVLPLIESLESPDRVVRRNVALTLGYLGDRRAVPVLSWMAAADEDGTARATARDALGKLGGAQNPVLALRQEGDDYSARKPLLLAGASNVVWDWTAKGLLPTSVPAEIYPDEMAKRSFLRALRADPSSAEALAGVGRSAAAEVATMDALKAAGKDVGEIEARLEANVLAQHLAGGEGAEAALKKVDEQAHAATVAALAAIPSAPVSELETGLHSGDAARRSIAAVGLGKLAFAGERSAGADVVGALAETVGREIVRIAMIIDADLDRASAIARALEAEGVVVTAAGRGARGLSSVHRLPGLDAVLVADMLPDLTTQQVIDDLRDDPRLAALPILVISADADSAKELYGSSTQGIIAGADGAAAVMEAIGKELSGDRKRAEQISAHSVEVLAALASKGVDVRVAVPALAATLARRPDAVATPAARALGYAGGVSETQPLLAALANEKRSDDARAAAGHALADILARTGGALSVDGYSVLANVMHSNASVPVRAAAAHALGRSNLSPHARVEILLYLSAPPATHEDAAEKGEKAGA